MTGLTINTRDRWNARPPEGSMTPQSWRDVQELFIHWPGEGVQTYAHINTRREAAAQLRAWQNFHIDTRGWSDIGYSFLCFTPRGELGFGDSLWVGRKRRAGNGLYVPASQLAHNTGTVSLCVALGEDEKTSDQLESRIRSFVRWANERAGRRLRVRGHGEVFGTECPGPQLRAIVRDLA